MKKTILFFLLSFTTLSFSQKEKILKFNSLLDNDTSFKTEINIILYYQNKNVMKASVGEVIAFSNIVGEPVEEEWDGIKILTYTLADQNNSLIAFLIHCYDINKVYIIDLEENVVEYSYDFNLKNSIEVLKYSYLQTEKSEYVKEDVILAFLEVNNEPVIKLKLGKKNDQFYINIKEEDGGVNNLGVRYKVYTSKSAGFIRTIFNIFENGEVYIKYLDTYDEKKHEYQHVDGNDRFIKLKK